MAAIKIKKSTLIEAIQTIKPGLSNKEISGVEQSDCICFMDGKLVAFNDTICVHTKIPLDISSTAIHAAEFMDAINKSNPDEDGNLSLEFKNSELVIKAGVEGKKRKAIIGLTLRNEVKLPSHKIITNIKGWKDLHPDLLRGIAFCIPAAAKSMVKPILQALSFTKEYIDASDGYRISRYFLDGEASKLLGEVPASSLEKMLGTPFNPCQFAISNNFIHFSDGMENTIFSCRVMTGIGDYPHATITKMIFIKDGKEIAFPKDVLTSLERCSIFKPAVEQDEDVQIALTKNTLTISSETSFGWMKDEMESEYSGPEVTFFISPTNLQYILKHTNDAILGSNTIEFETKEFIHSMVLACKD